MKGRISSFQSLGTLDGPGVRVVVFANGCPLRCGYCHNPETWAECGDDVEVQVLAERIIRLLPYLKKGGVTFSGGEPLAQAEFFIALTRILKAAGLHIALDTSGSVRGDEVSELLGLVDLVLLDVKFTTESDYKKYTGGSLASVIDTLAELHAKGKRVWIRQVIVPGLNDGEDNLAHMIDLLAPHKEIIDRVEFLPFRKLCLEKYERLGMAFPFGSYEQTPSEVTDNLNECIKKALSI